jgi:hypothetical protein
MAPAQALLSSFRKSGHASGPEGFVNFGAKVDVAKDPIAPVAAVKATGGSMGGDARPFGNTGLVIDIPIDPAGNRLVDSCP